MISCWTQGNCPCSPFILQPRFLQFLEIWFKKSGWSNLVRQIWFEKSGWPEKKVVLYYKSTLFSGQPLFSNHFSRTTILETLFSNHFSRTTWKSGFRLNGRLGSVEFCKDLFHLLSMLWNNDRFSQCRILSKYCFI